MDAGDPPRTGDDPALGRTLSYQDAPRAPQPGELTRGSRVHRYTVLERVGEGGMGVVYAAYDPSLDRRVALKFLRSEDPGRDGVRERRLLREAQAMARLSHPNVAVVYEVGTFHGHVFVAMEFVDGVDLRTWLAAKSRSLSEILDLFLAAGRGLAAAHAAGIIHRDFKPENVLVDKNDRPRVTDFGLSRSERPGEADPDPVPDLPADPLGTPSHLSTSLTRTGGILGTPWYMSPEQHRGAEVDARADQFGFCVALHEAVTGGRPFGGATPAEIAEAIIGRRISVTDSAMPRWLRAVVLRGLEPNAADRWPNMDALLAALSRSQASRRRRWVASGAGVAVVAAVVTAWLSGADASEACPPARDKVAGIWTTPVRDKVRAAFLATGRPQALTVFGRADRAFDERLSIWVAAHREACRDTRVRGEQSEALLDLRMQCLERARRQMEALPDIWQESVNLSEAVRAALTVGDVDACSDASALTVPVVPPRDPDIMRRVEALKGHLDRVAVLQRAGQLESGRVEARRALTEARQIGYTPVLAEALHRSGQSELDAGEEDLGLDLLHEAFRSANLAHDDVRAVTTARLLLYYTSFSVKHRADADLLWKMAEAALARVPHNDDLRADLLNAQGVFLFYKRKRREAAEYLRRALALKEKVHGPLHYQVFASANTLAAFTSDSPYVEEALAASQRAIAIMERTFGEENQYFVKALVNRAIIHLELGDYAEASRVAERGLALQSKNAPPDHPVTALSLNMLASVNGLQDKDAEARSLEERAMGILERSRGPDDLLLASVRAHLAHLALRRGEVQVARELLDKALAVDHKSSADGNSSPSMQIVLGSLLLLERNPTGARAAFEQSLASGRKRGEDPMEVAAATIGLGEVALFEKKPDEALDAFKKAADVFTTRPATVKHPMLVPILTGQGRAHLLAGQASQAIAVLEEADRLAEARGSSTRIAGARARFALAQARWAAGERERAIELATGARDVLAGRFEAGEVEAWLRRHSAR